MLNEAYLTWIFSYHSLKLRTVHNTSAPHLGATLNWNHAKKKKCKILENAALNTPRKGHVLAVWELKQGRVSSCSTSTRTWVKWLTQCPPRGVCPQMTTKPPTCWRWAHRFQANLHMLRLTTAHHLRITELCLPERGTFKFVLNKQLTKKSSYS